MIYGIGIDLVKTDRVREVVEKWGKRFLERVFTDEEISYCLRKRNTYLSIAVRFAAKEALIKAMGGRAPVSFKDIEVVNVGSGKPALNIEGAMGKFLDGEGIRASHLSLSHEKDYGVACVVLER